MFHSEGKITCFSFASLCKVVVINAVMIMLEGRITWVKFPSCYHAFDGNVVVPVGKLTHVSFDSTCNVVVRNALFFSYKES